MSRHTQLFCSNHRFAYFSRVESEFDGLRMISKEALPVRSHRKVGSDAPIPLVEHAVDPEVITASAVDACRKAWFLSVPVHGRV